jgi:GNAT superfamily N-acetyltransferase/predicted N-acyltransferase
LAPALAPSLADLFAQLDAERNPFIHPNLLRASDAHALARATDSRRALVVVGVAPGDRVVGFVSFFFVGDYARLNLTALAPDWRGRGLARPLLRAALVETRRAGARTVGLNVYRENTPAVATYLGEGFTFCEPYGLGMRLALLRQLVHVIGPLPALTYLIPVAIKLARLPAGAILDMQADLSRLPSCHEARPEPRSSRRTARTIPDPRESAVGASLHSGDVTVERLTSAFEAEWNRYVEAHPARSIYHTLAWRDVVTEATGHEPCYLLARDGRTVTGVLPLFVVTGLLGRRSLVGLPYEACHGSGLAGSTAAQVALAQGAQSLQAELAACSLELRSDQSRSDLIALGFRERPTFLWSSVPLQDATTNARMATHSCRKGVRHAKKLGLSVSVARDLQQMEQFADVVSTVWRSFGTPMLDRRLFRAFWQRLVAEDLATVLMAHHHGRLIGGALLLHYGPTLIIKFSACLPDALPLRPYNALFWHSLELGLARGCASMHFGTTSRHDDGLLRFKASFGARHQPVYYYTFPAARAPRDAQALIDGYGWARAVWRRLPRPLCDALGARLTRWVC